LKKTSLALQIALFTFIRLVTSIAYRMVYPLLPAFRDGLQVSPNALILAIGSRSLVGAFLGPLFASFGDSRGRKTGMLIGMAIFTLGVAVVVFWPTFPGFVLALMLTYVGKVTFDPTMQAFIADRVPYARRGSAITFTELSWSLANIVGIPLVGWVIASTNWIGPFYLLGVLIVMSAVVFIFTVPKDPAKSTAAPNILATFGLIFQSNTAKAAVALTLFACSANELINLAFGLWLEASFELRLVALGGTAAVLGIAELSGEGLVALVTDRLGKRRAIFLGLLVNSISIIVLPFMEASLVGAVFSLFLFYISFEFFIVSSIPLMTEVLPQARTTMMAGFFTSAAIGRALASAISPGLYALGFGFIVAVTVLLNLLAMASISRLRLESEEAAND
jgi:predicted MFS family arabinose efflux permease